MIEDHVNNLKAALGNLDVLIGFVKPRGCRYGEKILGPDEIEETENEKHARYVCYWNEFKPELTPSQFRCITLYYCRLKPWPFVARKTCIEDPERVAEDGLTLIACRVETLLRRNDE